MTEIGSEWVTALTDPVKGNAITLAEITRVEVAAALAARHRSPGGITREERDAAVGLMLRHCEEEYLLVPISNAVIGRAVELTQLHRLRGYDAIQLSAAFTANDALVGAGLPPLTFVAADADLIAAARTDGLRWANPTQPG